MPKKRKKLKVAEGWDDERVTREALAAMDADEQVSELSLGELPSWLGKRWARPKVSASLRWMASSADDLPRLYSRRGERLCVEAGVGLGRILEKSMVRHDANADLLDLLSQYIHPSSLARWLAYALDRWVDVHAENDAQMGLLRRRWVLYAHARFADRHGLESLVSVLCNVHHTQRLTNVDRQAGIRALAHSGPLGLAMARTLEYDPSHAVRSDARTALKHTIQRRFYATVMEDDELGPLTLDEQAEVFDALGFAEGQRAIVDEDSGEERWVGLEIFERLVDADLDEEHPGARHPIPDDSVSRPLAVAARLFSILFEQTAAALDDAMRHEVTWAHETWQVQFVEHDYFAFWSKRVLWSGLDASATQPFVFRVCDDLTLADEHDDPLELDRTHRLTIQLARSAALSEAERQRWGEVLADYEILAPLEQLAPLD